MEKLVKVPKCGKEILVTEGVDEECNGVKYHWEKQWSGGFEDEWYVIKWEE